MPKVLMDLGRIQTDLPKYESPPSWIPIEHRPGHPDYDNDLLQFLPRTVKLRRTKVSDALGFNIRGGQEHHCGIYVSKVTPGTEAERLGLKEADQILMVNANSFENIEHSQAVRVLKSNADVQLLVKYFPYGYNKTYEKTRMLEAIQQQNMQQGYDWS